MNENDDSAEASRVMTRSRAGLVAIIVGGAMLVPAVVHQVVNPTVWQYWILIGVDVGMLAAAMWLRWRPRRRSYPGR